MPIEEKTGSVDEAVEVSEEVTVEETHDVISGTNKRTRKRTPTSANPPLNELNALTNKAVRAGQDRNRRLEKAIAKQKKKFLDDEAKANK